MAHATPGRGLAATSDAAEPRSAAEPAEPHATTEVDGRQEADEAGELPAGDDVDLIAQAWQRERPQTPVASIGVFTRIRRIGKLLDDDRRRTLARLGMDSATLDLLSTLRRAGPPYQLSPGQLARRTLVSAGAISQRVARAERDGLVRRVRAGRAGQAGGAGQDGRSVRVVLTPAGHALVERTVDELLRHEESLLDPLTPRERTRLADLLRKLHAGLPR